VYGSGGAVRYSEDAHFGYDQFARAALQTFRNSYLPGMTSSTNEFARFFSGPNYAFLMERTRALSGYDPDPESVYESMMWAFQMEVPRSDMYDPRTFKFDEPTVQSFVSELNERVLEKAVSDTVAANQLWDGYTHFLTGRVPFDNDVNIATDVKGKACTYAMDYWLP
jgi:hypothetical protein